jgi:hypothetical protein
MSDSADQTTVTVGASVVALDGTVLGDVREIHPHYILVGEQDDPHFDLDVPVRAIARVEGNKVHLKVNRSALTEVDDTESANRRLGQER